MAITRNKEPKKQTGGDSRPAMQEASHGALVTNTPQISPPEQAAQRTDQAEESASVTLWRRNQRITGLWSKNETRNSWISIAGIGWRRLANTTDSGVTALTILASQALATGRNIDCREEPDGLIHEIYLW